MTSPRPNRGCRCSTWNNRARRPCMLSNGDCCAFERNASSRPEASSLNGFSSCWAQAVDCSTWNNGLPLARQRMQMFHVEQLRPSTMDPQQRGLLCFRAEGSICLESSSPNGFSSCGAQAVDCSTWNNGLPLARQRMQMFHVEQLRPSTIHPLQRGLRCFRAEGSICLESLSPNGFPSCGAQAVDCSTWNNGLPLSRQRM